MGGDGVDDDRPVPIDPSVEGEQAGTNLERPLIGKDDVGLQGSVPDQRLPAGAQGLLAGPVAELAQGAGRQPLSGDHRLSRQPQFDGSDSRQQRPVGGLQASLESHRDRRRMIAGQLQRRDPAVEGDDQVAALSSLAVGLTRQPPPQPRQGRQGRQGAQREQSPRCAATRQR